MDSETLTVIFAVIAVLGALVSLAATIYTEITLRRRRHSSDLRKRLSRRGGR